MVLCVVDRPGWAHDRKTAALASVLADRYRIVTRFQHEVTAEDLESADLGGLEEMRDFHHSLDVYVCASKSEGIPNPCLEEVASGLPVVTTRVGGMPELIRDGDKASSSSATSPTSPGGSTSFAVTRSYAPASDTPPAPRWRPGTGGIRRPGASMRCSAVRSAESTTDEPRGEVI